MRSNRGTMAEMLRRAAQNNAQIARWIDEVDTLDIDAITAQPWIKEALKQIKRVNSSNEETARIEEVLDHGGMQMKTLSSVDGEIRRWLGERSFIEMDRGGMIEIPEGKLLWFPDDGGVWYETIFTSKGAHELYHHSKFVRRAKKLDYIAMYRDEINRNADPTHVIDLTGQNSPAKNSIPGLSGVRITRHD